ncbi:MAG: hypothetical protein ACJAY8_000444 [Sphingobacteriales bacterium]|jgi:hypothetical protein
MMRIFIAFAFLITPFFGLAQLDVLQWQNPIAFQYFQKSDSLNTGVYTGTKGVVGLGVNEARFGGKQAIVGAKGFAFQGGLTFDVNQTQNSVGNQTNTEYQIKPRILGNLSYEIQGKKLKFNTWIASRHREFYDRLKSGSAEFGIRLKYDAKPWLNFQVGLDRNHFGYGIRSLFLSRAAPVLPFFAADFKIGNRIRLYNHFAILNHHEKFFNPFRKAELVHGADVVGHRRDYMASHVIEWNVVPTFQLMLFDAVVWAGEDKYGYRGFDPTYLNPFGFYRSIEFSSGSSDNALVGLAARWKVHRKIKLYGSFLLDEFLLSEIKAQNGWWGNKFAIQAGGELALGSKAVIGGEVNIVRPFTYSHFDQRQSFTTTGQPLALPWGGRGAEILFFAHYFGEDSYTRFQGSFLKKGNGKGGNPLYSLAENADPYGYDLFNISAGSSNTIAFSLSHQIQIKPNGKSLGLKVGALFPDNERFRINVGVIYSSGIGRYF